eukprot:3610262-Pyramimonas_sp.AAC.1
MTPDFGSAVLVQEMHPKRCEKVGWALPPGKTRAHIYAKNKCGNSGGEVGRKSASKECER